MPSFGPPLRTLTAHCSAPAPPATLQSPLPASPPHFPPPPGTLAAPPKTLRLPLPASHLHPHLVKMQHRCVAHGLWQLKI